MGGGSPPAAGALLRSAPGGPPEPRRGGDPRRAAPPDRADLLGRRPRRPLRRGDRLVPGGRPLGRPRGGERARSPGDHRRHLLPLPARRHRLGGGTPPSSGLERRSGSNRAARFQSGAGSVLGPLEHDPLGLDRHLQRPVALPVLGVDRIVLDRGVQPQSVALLLAMIEGGLELSALAAPAPATAAPPAPAPAATPLLLALALVLGFG